MKRTAPVEPRDSIDAENQRRASNERGCATGGHQSKEPDSLVTPTDQAQACSHCQDREDERANQETEHA